MKTNTNIGFELWYSVLNVFFLKKQPYRVRYQIKAKNKNITVTFSVLLLFDVRRCQDKQKSLIHTFIHFFYYDRLSIEFSQHLPGFSTR